MKITKLTSVVFATNPLILSIPHGLNKTVLHISHVVNKYTPNQSLGDLGNTILCLGWIFAQVSLTSKSLRKYTHQSQEILLFA